MRPAKSSTFAGSLRSRKRAAAIMNLIQSAWLNGHDSYAYLKDVLTRLPTQRASESGQLLPHQWVAAKVGDSKNHASSDALGVASMEHLTV
jgi:hypothetical protein